MVKKKKFKSIRYTRRGLKITVTVQDENYGKLDTFRCHANEFPKVVKTLHEAYGVPFFKPEIPPEKSINALKENH